MATKKSESDFSHATTTTTTVLRVTGSHKVVKVVIENTSI